MTSYDFIRCFSKKMEAFRLLKYTSFPFIQNGWSFLAPPGNSPVSRNASLLKFIFFTAYNFGKLTAHFYQLILGASE